MANISYQKSVTDSGQQEAVELLEGYSESLGRCRMGNANSCSGSSLSLDHQSYASFAKKLLCLQKL